MNAPTARGAAKPYGADQTGKREFCAWVDHKGKRHRLGAFDRKPEALRVARGVFYGLRERHGIIAGKGWVGPFPRWADKTPTNKSADPHFSPEKNLINQLCPDAKNGGSVRLHGPRVSCPYSAVYVADRDRWRARVGTGKNRRWVGLFATKAEAEHAAKLASGATA